MANESNDLLKDVLEQSGITEEDSFDLPDPNSDASAVPSQPLHSTLRNVVPKNMQPIIISRPAPISVSMAPSTPQLQTTLQGSNGIPLQQPRTILVTQAGQLSSHFASILSAVQSQNPGAQKFVLRQISTSTMSPSVSSGNTQTVKLIQQSLPNGGHKVVRVVSPHPSSIHPPVRVINHSNLSGGKVTNRPQLLHTVASNGGLPHVVSSPHALTGLRAGVPQRVTVSPSTNGQHSLKSMLPADHSMVPSVKKEPCIMGPKRSRAPLKKQTFVAPLPNAVMPKAHHFVEESLEEEIDEEMEELGHAETYAEYMPSKLRIGEKHPDPVVETSSLSSVIPPDIHYQLSIPEETIDRGQLSALQLEAVVYASQRHSTFLPSGHRAGFLIGDGAGVGKGRTLAGIISENYLLGRKRSVWLSVSSDLRVDAERDLKDIGARIPVYALNKFKYAKISSKENGSVKKGVIFATYSSLIGESQTHTKYRTRLKMLLKWFGKDYDGVIVFDECHKAKNLCPVGSSKPTKTGQKVKELQDLLPKARIVYASATGASEPKNMAYMTRLGLWGEGTLFPEFNDFISIVEKRGVGAMEQVAIDMKARGLYIARQLSFHGVSFKIEEVKLDQDLIKMWDLSVDWWYDCFTKFGKCAESESRQTKAMWAQFWSANQRFFKTLCIYAKVRRCVEIAREAVKNGKCVVIGLQSTGEAQTLEQLEEAGGELDDFISTAKGVLQSLVEKHFPSPDRVKTSLSFLGSSSVAKNKNSCWSDLISKKTPGSGTSSDSSGSDDSSEISLSESSEDDSDSSDSDNANPFRFMEGDDDDLQPPKKKAKMSKKETSKQKKKKKKKTKKKEEEDEDAKFERMMQEKGILGHLGRGSNPWPHAIQLNGEEAISMKADLMKKIDTLGKYLPPNTLDFLIDELGGPEMVAEMTGRKGRVVSTENGEVTYQSRAENDVSLEMLNLEEKRRFMDGEKYIAIISEAASSGISLQADKRVLNRRRRVHVTLELPWSADRAIQQFGRTHRSNQVNAPEYVFLISELAGERRFASTVAKRLESLGALTHGDRRATETRDLSQFNIDNRYGRQALDNILKTIMINDVPSVPFPKNYKGNFVEDCKQALTGVGMLNKYGGPEKDICNISKFLNRILCMKVAVQNALFQFFSDMMTAVILDAKRNGVWDLGILDLGSGEERVKKKCSEIYIGTEEMNFARMELTTVEIERGMAWWKALQLWQKCESCEEGFYLTRLPRSNKLTAILVVKLGRNKNRDLVFTVYRPNTGRANRTETLEELKKKYQKALPDAAQQWWELQYEASAKICIHAYWKGRCKNAALLNSCEVGIRTRDYHILHGSVVGIWKKLDDAINASPGIVHQSKVQTVRLKLDNGNKIVGNLIPSSYLVALRCVLKKDSTRVVEEKVEDVPPVENLSMPELV